MSFQYDMGYVNFRPIDIGTVLTNNSYMNNMMAAKGLAQWKAGQMVGSGLYQHAPAVMAQCRNVPSGTTCGSNEVTRMDTARGGKICCANADPSAGYKMGSSP
jgi:hypothetical protein